MVVDEAKGLEFGAVIADHSSLNPSVEKHCVND